MTVLDLIRDELLEERQFVIHRTRVVQALVEVVDQHGAVPATLVEREQRAPPRTCHVPLLHDRSQLQRRNSCDLVLLGRLVAEDEDVLARVHGQLAARPQRLGDANEVDAPVQDLNHAPGQGQQRQTPAQQQKRRISAARLSAGDLFQSHGPRRVR